MLSDKALCYNCADKAVWYNDTPCWHSYTIYHNAVGSGGIKEPCIRWGSRSAHAKEQFLAERTCSGMPEDTPRWAVLKWAANRSRCRLVSGLGWVEWSGGDAALCQITLTTCYCCNYMYYYYTDLKIQTASARNLAIENRSRVSGSVKTTVPVQ